VFDCYCYCEVCLLQLNNNNNNNNVHVRFVLCVLIVFCKGTCVNVGCIPKKLMHHSAIIGHLLHVNTMFLYAVVAVTIVNYMIFIILL